MSDNPYASPPSMEPMLQYVSGPGYVNSVMLLTVFMIVQGALCVLMGLLYVGYGLLMPTMLELIQQQAPQGAPAPEFPEEMYWFITTFTSGMGALILISGATQIYAGIRNMQFRGRMLGIIAILSNALAIITCYCAPTGIALMVFGLIVYLNRPVIQAFEMGRAGLSRNEILRAFGLLPSGQIH